ncbi:MAG: uracil-DNA glycosylase [Defluviitaleaceae bacterium]|nr:uracil-DNA glycosylase [Defluviitaleaceae bacterium]
MIKMNNDWDGLLAEEFQKDYYLQLREFLKRAYKTTTVYPDMYDIFNALKFTAYSDVKVVIVGQDPYINPGEAHGLSFSVKPGARIPPSLANIYKEIADDIGCATPENGHLEFWARQGVLLLNNVLTVQAKRSRSHAGKGWEQFTDAVMDILDRRDAPMVFLLWGRDAQTKGRIIANPNHLILQAAHPSPLAGGRFFGCRHFSKTNEFLEKHGMEPVNWGMMHSDIAIPVETDKVE